jgi:hypothetical protein
MDFVNWKEQKLEQARLLKVKKYKTVLGHTLILILG